MTTPQNPASPKPSWEQHYASLQAFKAAHGSCDVPRGYVADDGLPLGQWLQDQKSQAQERLYPNENRQQLDALGVKWANQEGTPEPSGNSVGTGNPPGEDPAGDEGAAAAPRLRG